MLCRRRLNEEHAAGGLPSRLSSGIRLALLPNNDLLDLFRFYEIPSGLRLPMVHVVADLESPIDGHDRALAAIHPFGDSRDYEIGFRQKVSNPADLHFRHAPTLSSHSSHLLIQTVQWQPA